MDLIEKELNKINFIANQFSDERDTLIKVTETITEKLRKIIKELAPSYSLVSSNSVRQLTRYSFSPRVKETDSLREKMVRNNLYTKEFNLADDFNEMDSQLIKKIKSDLLRLDDLIGIKILADLNTDCIKMLELISSPEFIEKAIAQDIELDQDDLSEQPQIMRNGLNIYKIKGKYDKYTFELQIKSKIISAWGDMEHAIFYKDYSISPVRDTTQSSMNHVGKLLYDIDDFLESIRSANRDYLKNAQALTFLQWFDSKYTEKINDKLSEIGYRIDGISELLYSIHNHLDVNDETSTKALRFSHFELSGTEPSLDTYLLLRNKIYDLKILEGIVLSWMLEDNFQITAENIDVVLTNYLETIQVVTSNFLCSQHNGFDFDEILELIKSYYANAFKFNCKESFILNFNSLNLFMNARSYLIDISDSAISTANIELICQCVFIRINKGDIDSFLNYLRDVEGVELSKLNADLLIIRDLIDSRAKKLKIDIKEIVIYIITRFN